MGYCYDGRTGQLCCDQCGTHGGVRKVRCTYGYCPPPALCAACRGNKELMAGHRAHCREHCKPAAEEYAAQRAAEAAVLATGAYIFRAAIREGDKVRCTFRNAAGDTKDALLDRPVYEAARAGVAVTYEDVVGDGYDDRSEYERREDARLNAAEADGVGPAALAEFMAEHVKVIHVQLPGPREV